MALKPQMSFSSGELDPSLHERVDLEKYRAGLATARNVVVGKTGRILSRPGRRYFNSCEPGVPIRVHVMPHNGTYVEFTSQPDHTVNWYTMEGVLIDTQEYINVTEAQMERMRFVDVDDYGFLVLIDGYPSAYFFLSSGVINLTTTAISGYFYFYNFVSTPTFVSNSAGGTGYDVSYAISTVDNGIESATLTTDTGKLPITSTTKNAIVVNLGLTANLVNLNEIKVYRKPRNGGAFGYIGSSINFGTSGADTTATFEDVGQEADYTHSPPSDVMSFNASAENFAGGLVYQQRLCVFKDNIMFFSKIGYLRDLRRDYPYNDSSAIAIRIGGGDISTGSLKILWTIDYNGLVVFTTQGIYLHSGALGPSNLGFNKRNGSIIDKNVPPIVVPGGLLFVDSVTNTVRRLIYSDEQSAYVAEEMSVFSDHLFLGNKIKSWSFEGGDVPLLWVVFENGDVVSFNFEPLHKMNSWTRHDSLLPAEYVVSTPRRYAVYNTATDVYDLTDVPGETFVVYKDTDDRYIDQIVPRYVSSDIKIANSEWDKNESIAAMDSMVSWEYLLNDDLVGADVFTLTPTTPGDWEGTLTLTCGTSGVFINATVGGVGQVYRWFHPVDRSAIDLTITARAGDNSITVQPSAEFDSDYASDMRLYWTKTTFTGLDHMEGESVSIISDGYVLASPNNDVENYDVVTVASGSITLPNSERGAIVHIGRPYTMDVETLDIDTVEQRPVLIESMTLNKLYIKVKEFRGFYINGRFPDDDDALTGLDTTTMSEVEMVDPSSYGVDYEDPDPIIGNRYDQPVDKRIEVVLPGDWKSQGRVCIRQVDPLHFEILSIIPDLTDIQRMNKPGGGE